MSYTVAVVGAMGAVGTEMLKTLEKSNIPISKIVPLDVKANEGKTVVFKGEEATVKAAEKGAFVGVDIAIFSAGATASKKLAPIAVEEGATVVDNSSAWRMEPEIPLIVPEVNPEAAKGHKGLIANPNCSTIQMLVALKPLHDKFNIKRIVVSTYQAISGSGLKAIQEMNDQVEAHVKGEEIPYNVYPHQILFNAIPHIDIFLDNRYTKEEMKMFNETRKIMDPNIQVSPTAVRIPVFRCHSESINIETEKPMPEFEEIVEILKAAPGVEVIDDIANNQYPMPVKHKDTSKTYVGRIRKDFTIPNDCGLNLWVVADNLRKGAALNAVQIAELLVEKNWVKKEE